MKWNHIVSAPKPAMEKTRHLSISHKSNFINLIPKIDEIILQMEKDGTIASIKKKYKGKNIVSEK